MRPTRAGSRLGHATKLGFRARCAGVQMTNPLTAPASSVSEEYTALRTGAMLVDRSARGRLRIHGPKASELVTGLVSNDVTALAPGQGCYAAALTPKGKIFADV